MTQFSRPKFMTGFNFGSRVARGLAAKLSPPALEEKSHEFKSGYQAGSIVGTQITDNLSATEKLDEAWRLFNTSPGLLVQ